MHELVNCEEAKILEKDMKVGIFSWLRKKKKEEAIGTSNSDIRSM